MYFFSNMYFLVIIFSNNNVLSWSDNDSDMFCAIVRKNATIIKFYLINL